jgi:hypothetical protein
VVRREVQSKLDGNGKALLSALEVNEPLLAFTPEQRNVIEQQLTLTGFAASAAGRFHNEGWLAEALLEDGVLYMSATGHGVFEIGMFASELTSFAPVAKFDPQANEWESDTE